MAVLALTLGVVLAACGTQEPTTVGAPLFPNGSVSTFQVTLNGPEFMVVDTSVTGFVLPGQSPLMVVANQFADSLNSHTLISLLTAPTSVQYTDTLGVTMTDTVPRWTGADIILSSDSSSLGTGPATLSLNLEPESWDRLTADWDNRVDSTGAHVPWTQAGGTVGAQLATAVWTPGTDSVIFHVDSQTVVLLQDSTIAKRGVIVSSLTPGARVESRQVSVVYYAVPSERPDTVVTTSYGANGTTFLYTPSQAPTSYLRLGGLPTWRTVIEFRQRLDTLQLPCPGEPGCLIPLNKATITAADLMLQPEVPQAGFVPEEPLQMDVRPVFRSLLVPVSRSPLGTSVGTGPTVPIPTSAFENAGSARVAVPIAAYISSLIAAQDTASALAPPSTVALLPFQSHDIFGIGTFGSLRSGQDAPQLRLVLTIAEEALIR